MTELSKEELLAQIEDLSRQLTEVNQEKADLEILLEMITEHSKVQAFNQEGESQGYSPIQVGMGIHLGHMMVGVVGEQDRLQEDTLSDTVNLTSRWEELTKYYGVSMVISGDVLERLSHPKQYKVRSIDRTIVKGRSEPITAYEVLDVETEFIQTLKLQTLPDFEPGFDHYRNGDLKAAQTCFKQVLIANPLDKTAKLYLKRIAQLANQIIPKNWRGIWVFTEKSGCIKK